ncbi:actin-like ATPase domain-containing protein [Hortaea werneckii]|nr:actin-like ATPase domain-containing protein [Hortaea werneckii]KAI7069481.1 actin-like ATPase domain-containing protein [Hortaea werneckii]KAI7217234.1 actin-like ATPase domain-containing protein [Hortaea werneckii]KAI7297352.1 actin-like ATPase domain-containing protein [Hortaea werneckii]KAI7383112.1 actin-like ATPase domain-containing protein [Hortaea werneckii]
MPHFTVPVHSSTSRNSPKPPPERPYTVSEPPYSGQLATDTATYDSSSPDTAIVIDNGSSSVRAGWQSDNTPRLQFPPLMARYTDRKLNRKLCFIGSEIYFDGTARGQAKNIYEPGSNIINNWDVQEGVLDYVFLKLGIDGQNSVIDRPVVMTEPLANLGYTRKVMSEILYELYGVPSVAYGVDSLFSYDYNGGTTGLVTSSAHMSTHLIPVVDKQPLISQATRLDWGRSQCMEYLTRLLKAKYPGLLAAGKVNETQIEDIVRNHCYVSQDYDREMLRMLDWSGLEGRNHTVQLPFQEKEVVQKTEEEIKKAEEKKREGGRRLQEQAAKMRLEKLIRKEQELEWFKEVQINVQNATTKKEKQALLDEEEFRDEIALDKRIKEMEKSIRRQRNKDVGDMEEEQDEPPTYPLLEIPDDQLDEEGIKAKRQQRLLKSNHDARARAKAEKEAEKARQAEIQRQDDLRRENDLEGWVEERRIARQATIQKMRDRERLKADLGNRKSQASQMRMKTIANLASDNPFNRKRRRGQAADDDGFGADDADWAVYRDIGRGEDDEEDEEEDLEAQLKAVESQLLKYDPHFTEEKTLEGQKDWTKSLVHSFLRGPYAFDPESSRESNQFHLNLERIRVPEVVFQPNIAGVDQAGITEIAEDILNTRLASHPARSALLKDVFVTGGYSLFQGFEERLRSELRAVLPTEVELGVRKAKDPVLDAWRGAAKWAATPQSRQAFVTKKEWEEKGGEYIKEHNLGNVFT